MSRTVSRADRVSKSSTVAALAVAGCAGLAACAPSYFSHQSVPFRQNAAMQAQLGNLGIRGTATDYGFQKGAFLSECGVRELDVSVDARMPQVKAAEKAFGDKATLSSIGPTLGYTRDELEKMSMLIFSVSPIELADRLQQGLSPKCQKFIEKNGESVRFVTSVAVVLDYEVLRKTTADLDVNGELRDRGGMLLTTRLGETNSLDVGTASVFAYRTSRLCWRPDGRDIILMADDPGFDDCPEGYEAEPPWGWKWAMVQPRQQQPEPKPTASAE